MRGNDSCQKKLLKILDIIEFQEWTFEIRVIFEPFSIAIFQSCLLPKMRLSVVLEGKYIGYKNAVYQTALELQKSSADR